MRHAGRQEAGDECAVRRKTGINHEALPFADKKAHEVSRNGDGLASCELLNLVPRGAGRCLVEVQRVPASGASSFSQVSMLIVHICTPATRSAMVSRVSALETQDSNQLVS
jgi:hypothetical protein